MAVQRSQAVARNSTKSGACTRSSGPRPNGSGGTIGAQPDLAHPVADQEGPARHLEARQELAIDQLDLAVLQRVILGVHGQHDRWLRREGRMVGIAQFWYATPAPYSAKESAMRSRDFSFRADE